MDSAATSQKPASVLRTLRDFYENSNANIHRGAHQLSNEASVLYEKAREKAAAFIDADPEEIIFLNNTTEAINFLALSWGEQNLKEGDEILLSALEHHSNLIPWQLLARRKKLHLRYLALDEEGALKPEALREALKPETKLIALHLASNVLGSMMPVELLAEEAARRPGRFLFLDGAQGVPHLPSSFRKMNVDGLAFSGHKMLGPMGGGVLCVKKEHLAKLAPPFGGGGMISRVREQSSDYREAPFRFEPGTPDAAGIIAFGAALDYLSAVGMERIRAHEKELIAYALDRLSRVEKIRIFGPRDPEKQTGVLSFSLGSLHPHDISSLLDSRGIAVRAGHHCAQLLMRHLGVQALTRASFYLYNTKDEIDYLADSLKNILKIVP